jgi:hypothetical protein
VTNGPVEPSADLRQFAANMHQMFIALVNEGFTEQQALAVIGGWLAAVLGGGL